MRIIGSLSVSVVLVRAILLLTIGGTVIVQRTVELGEPPAPAVMVQEPVYQAIIPLIISLIPLLGFIRDRLSFIWLGGMALVIVGIMFMFSLGLWITGIGLAVLLMALVLSRSSIR